MILEGRACRVPGPQLSGQITTNRTPSDYAETLALGPVDWSTLAQTAGYFDHAHFSREFKDFTGHTPTQYLALLRRFSTEREGPQDSGPMPAD